MATMRCEQFLQDLESWIEGERPPHAQAHARECVSCRGFVEDLGAIGAAVGEWRGSPEIDPPARLWTALRAQLEHEGLIREPRARWFSGVFAALPRPAFAGAYLAILIAVGFSLSGPIHKRMNDRSWIQGTQTSTRPLDAELGNVERSTISAVANASPLVTASLHQNLAVVDNYIALCEKSVREEPENEFARDYLYNAYQQKAELLGDLAERGAYGR